MGMCWGVGAISIVCSNMYKRTQCVIFRISMLLSTFKWARTAFPVMRVYAEMCSGCARTTVN